VSIITGIIENFYIAIIAVIVATYLLNWVADILSDVLHLIGLKLNIPHSVRGATFDAAASSLPEFFTALIAVLVHQQFNDIGFGTIAGSGIFNVLLIPMLAILAFKGKNINVDLNKKGVFRDMFFYSAAISILIYFTAKGQYTSITGIVLISVYMAYLIKLYFETKKHQSEVEERTEEIEEAGGDKPYSKLLIISLFCLIGIYVLIDIIIKGALVIAATLHIPTIIVSLIVLASATSIPDTMLSIKSSKRGDIDGALSNAVGSNIFDISICLGVPLLFIKNPVIINFNENIGIIAFLLISMFTTAFVLLHKKGIKKKSVIYMAIAYSGFLIYIILVGMKVI